MSYTRVNWQDSPSTATPISAANLNNMDAGIEQNASDIADLQSHTYDTALDSTSTNAPQTKVVQSALDTVNTTIGANTTAIEELQATNDDHDVSIADLKANVGNLFSGVKDDDPNITYTQCELENGTFVNKTFDICLDRYLRYSTSEITNTSCIYDATGDTATLTCQFTVPAANL